MRTLSIFDPWEIGGHTGRIECARPIWEEIAGFAMKGFQRSPSGGPEVGGLLFGHRMPDRVRIDAWREIACEHAGGPFFELSEQDEEALRLLLQDSNGLEVVGWFQSKYWDTRWSQSQSWVFALSPADVDLHKRHFPEPWQVVLIIQRTKSEPLRAGFFFRKENGSLDSMARDFTQVGAVPPVAFERNSPTASPPMKTVDPVTAPSGAQPAATAEIESTQETSANSPAPGIGFVRNENDLLDWMVVSTQTPPNSPEHAAMAGRKKNAAPSPGEDAPTASELAIETIDPVREPLNVAQSATITEIVPIQQSSDSEFIYWSPQQRQVLTDLLSNVENRGGIAVLTGDVGTGKTTLMLRLGDRLAEGGVEFGLVLNSRVTVEQFYKTLAYDLALEATDGSRLTVLSELRKLAIKQASVRRATALLIDEAHNLPADVMEEVRLLDNLEFRNVKLLQIVLAGQPKLNVALEKPELSRLRQQVILHCALGALSEAETCEFIAQKLTLADAPSPCVFPPDVGREIHSLSRGIPRVINTVCENLLKTCTEAGSKMATLGMLDKVSRQLQLGSSIRPR